MKPVLIVVEGPDGVGKTTRVRELAEDLRIVGNRTRQVTTWCHPRFIGDDAMERALWYATARAKFASDVRAGRYDDFIVVIDRWYYSTWVAAEKERFRSLMPGEYGPEMKDSEIAALVSLCEAERFSLPSVKVILLDAPSEIIAERLALRREKVLNGDINAQRSSYIAVKQSTRAETVNTADDPALARARMAEIAGGWL